MKTILEKFNDPTQSGVFHLMEKPEAVEEAANSAGLKLLRIDLKRVRGKAGLLNHAAKVLQFPRWFGKNWDAFHDCLSDFSWFDNRGYVILVENTNEFAARYPQTLKGAVEVFQSVADHWRSVGKPFWVLIDGPNDWNSGLERFP